MIRNALRVAALIAGLVLIAAPLWWLIDITKPLPPIPKYRKGADAGFDSLFVVKAFFAIYGSVLLGIAVHWVRAKRSAQPSSSSEVFKAGMLGMLVVCIAFFAGVSLYGLVKYASIEKAVGNLWGAVVIFWGILSALCVRRHRAALLCLGWSGETSERGTGNGTVVLTAKTT